MLKINAEALAIASNTVYIGNEGTTDFIRCSDSTINSFVRNINFNTNDITYLSGISVNWEPFTYVKDVTLNPSGSITVTKTTDYLVGSISKDTETTTVLTYAKWDLATLDFKKGLCTTTV